MKEYLDYDGLKVYDAAIKGYVEDKIAGIASDGVETISNAKIQALFAAPVVEDLDQVDDDF